MVLSFSTLRIGGGSDHDSLPDWVYFFLNLGIEMSQRSEDAKTRTMIACSLPTRSFAAPFFALGIVSDRIRKGASDAELEGRFQMLTLLPAETKFLYRKRDKLFKAVKAIDQRDTLIDKEPHLRVLIQNERGGNLAELVSKKRAMALEIAANQEFSLPKNTKGVQIPPVPVLLKAFFNVEEVNQALSRSRMDVLFVGNVSKLHEETCLAPFSYQDRNGVFHDGMLNDVLQIKNFCSSRQVHRSRIVTKADIKAGIDVSPETVVVFDGSLSFLHHFHECRGRVSLILLDRTEPQYQEAVAEINRRRLSKKIGSTSGTEWLGVVPAGVEVMVWEERF